MRPPTAAAAGRAGFSIPRRGAGPARRLKQGVRYASIRPAPPMGAPSVPNDSSAAAQPSNGQGEEVGGRTTLSGWPVLAAPPPYTVARGEPAARLRAGARHFVALPTRHLAPPAGAGTLRWHAHRRRRRGRLLPAAQAAAAGRRRGGRARLSPHPCSPARRFVPVWWRPPNLGEGQDLQGGGSSWVTIASPPSSPVFPLARPSPPQASNSPVACQP